MKLSLLMELELSTEALEIAPADPGANPLETPIVTAIAATTATQQRTIAAM